MPKAPASPVDLGVAGKTYGNTMCVNNGNCLNLINISKYSHVIYVNILMIVILLWHHMAVIDDSIDG